MKSERKQLAVSALMLIPSLLLAQGVGNVFIPEFGLNHGGIVAPLSAPETPGGVKILDEEVKLAGYLSASAINTEGSDIAGFSGGLVLQPLGEGLPTQIDYRYLDIAADDGSVHTDQHRVGLNQRLQLKALPEEAAVSVVGRYTDSQSSSELTEVFLSGSYQLPHEEPIFDSPVTFVANVGWAERDPDVGDSIDDWTVVVGAAVGLREDVRIYTDYTVENDVNNDHDFSVSIVHSLAASEIAVGYARGGVFYVAYTIPGIKLR